MQFRVFVIEQSFNWNRVKWHPHIVRDFPISGMPFFLKMTAFSSTSWELIMLKKLLVLSEMFSRYRSFKEVISRVFWYWGPPAQKEHDFLYSVPNDMKIIIYKRNTIKYIFVVSYNFFNRKNRKTFIFTGHPVCIGSRIKIIGLATEILWQKDVLTW